MKKHNYTLIELIAVVGITALVIAIALPGINLMVNGNKVERGAKQLSAAIAKARSEAIVTNRKVALLLPGNSSNIKTQYINSSYAIVVLKKGDDTDFDPEKNNDFKWERLPGKTFFTVYNGTFTAGTTEFFDQTNLKKENLSNVSDWSRKVVLNGSGSRFGQVLKNSGNTFAIPMLIFNPDGTVQTNNDLYFFITEGLIGSASGTVMPGGKKDNERPDGAIGFKVNKFTGRIKYHETL